jgi:tetratricopeptide (TPR) repeat protein
VALGQAASLDPNRVPSPRFTPKDWVLAWSGGLIFAGGDKWRLAAPALAAGHGKSCLINPAHMFAAELSSEKERFRCRLILQVLLVSLVLAVFGQASTYDFVHYDDQTYVYENREITAGLTVGGIVNAFIHSHARNWHPLTTLSHMVDCQVFGLQPGAHHLMNILFHAATALVFFGVLNAMTGAMWRSAFVAAVFAIHPLRAESVAWIAERKDVLSGMFFMLTLAAYVRYVRDRRVSRYLITVSFFVCALMSKPTVVTLPGLLLLLDYWPLNRIQREFTLRPNGPRSVAGQVVALVRSRIFLEKIPLLFLSFSAAMATLFVQRQTVGYGGALSLTGRFGNALVSYVVYIGQTIWPQHLAVFYPQNADGPPAIATGLSALLLVSITALAFRFRKEKPYLIVGWCWYVLALLPVIGIVQVGLQSHADRYTYLPQIGLCFAMTWAVADQVRLQAVFWRRIYATAAVLAVVVLAWRANLQTSSWQDTETLWTNAIAVTRNNDVAHYNIASLLMNQNRPDEAIAHYRAALQAGSNNETHNHLSPAIVENGLGNALARKGDLDAAVIHYRKAVELRPEFSDAHSNLAAMLYRKGEITGAISEYEKVVALPPEDASSHRTLAELLIKANRPEEAAAHLRRAVEIASANQ